MTLLIRLCQHELMLLLTIFSLKFEKINQNHVNKDFYAKDTNKTTETCQGNGKQWKMVF